MNLFQTYYYVNDRQSRLFLGTQVTRNYDALDCGYWWWVNEFALEYYMAEQVIVDCGTKLTSNFIG